MQELDPKVHHSYGPWAPISSTMKYLDPLLLIRPEAAQRAQIALIKEYTLNRTMEPYMV